MDIKTRLTYNFGYAYIETGDTKIEVDFDSIDLGQLISLFEDVAKYRGDFREASGLLIQAMDTLNINEKK